MGDGSTHDAAARDDYNAFLRGKVKVAPGLGFAVDPSEVNPALKDFVQAIVIWAAAGGRRGIFSSFGLHKCHGRGTAVLMHDGSIKAVEDVEVGEALMGDDGTPRRVLSLARGRDQLYRVKLKNGDSFVCNEGHILSLKMSNKHAGHRMGEVVNMPLRDLLALPEYAQRNCYKAYKVGLDCFPIQPVPFDPYLYGAWLGDGHQHTLAWTLNDLHDAPIVERVKTFARDKGLRIREQPGQGCTTYNLAREIRGRAPHIDEFYFVQSSAGPDGKRIDRRYLLNDRETRLQLLAGLIDTDGHLRDNCFIIPTKWEGLRDDMLFLARSLGFSVSHRVEVHMGAPYYYLTISGHTDEVPCITRKKASTRRQIKTPLVYGFDVEALLGEGDYFGFEIDGNHLYLLGDFTVTHNTSTQIELARLARIKTGALPLIVLPLGVRQEFFEEAKVRFTGNYAVELRFIRRSDEIDPADLSDGSDDYRLPDTPRIYLTNYESVREGKIDAGLFGFVSLDEAACLRGFGGTKTFREFMARLAGDDRRPDAQRDDGPGQDWGGVRYRFVATATPDPNEFIELLAYSAFLGVMQVGEAKTRFFKRDPEKADALTLHAHKAREFWLWVASWALFVTKPSDLGFPDDGYVMPAIDVRWHEVASDHATAGAERDGQGRLFANAGHGVSEAAREKRRSLDERVAKLMEIRAETPGVHRIIWHDLEDERRAIEAAVPGVRSIYGSQELEDNEAVAIDFKHGRFAELATKPQMSGAGCNFQHHCHHAAYLGIGHKFHDFIQSIHRLMRFGQAHQVRVDLIYTEAERDVRRSLEAKWARHVEQAGIMAEIVREYGLGSASLSAALHRALGVDRREIAGDGYKLVNNDSVLETRSMESCSVDLIVTSIPFSNQYEYTPSYNDLGHNEDSDRFWQQMDFLTPELLRVLKPGRWAVIHVKDRIVPGGLTGLGFQTVQPFQAEAIFHYRRHGFAYMGMKTVVTDVVRENNQTYRLGWTRQCQDATVMGAGLPEYLIMLRKPQTDRSRAYADERVVKAMPDFLDDAGRPATVKTGRPVPGTGYSRARWQTDAHAFMRSSGDRLLAPDDLAGLSAQQIYRLWKRVSLDTVYDFEDHMALGEWLDARGQLPPTFMLLPPHSWHPDVWSDVTRMRTLNGLQYAQGKEMHLCLARGSMVLTRGAGFRPIEQIAVGDMVLTHRGRWRPVTVVRQTGVQPVVTLAAQGVSGLTLTPDHKLWTRKVRSLAWSKLHSRREAAGVEPAWVDAADTVGSYVNLKLPPVESAPVESPHFWWVLGRWLADGHVSSRGDQFVISCGRHEIDDLRTRLGAFACEGNHDTGTSFQVSLRDPDGILRAMLRQCGRGAAHKHLPPAAYTLPAPQARAVLDGYLSGDGHYHAGRGRWTASSVSRELMLGMAMLAQRAYGAVASIYPGRPGGPATIEGRAVSTLPDWVLCFDLPRAGGKRHPFMLEDGAWKKVRRAEPAGEAETWCLRVEEDESFSAEGCIVKNCPLQFDIVDRAIAQLSQEGETVLDPFGGLGTVPYRAIALRRRGIAIELSHGYYLDAAAHCEAAVRQIAMPTLFDLAAVEDEADTPADIGAVA